MEMSSLSGLEGLSEIGLRGGADMRPTLLRVLTDLYVHKLAHTPDEERHYTELALRLLDSVDVATRSAVAARLAHHLSPPSTVIAKLAADLPEVAAALRRDPSPQSRGALAAAEPAFALASVAQPAAQAEAATAPSAIASDVAGELNELFFAANADERRLILRNLHIVAAVPVAGAGFASDPLIGRRLEAAALARRPSEFARELARSLRISPRQAQRIARDELGEPIVVAAKVLSIPRDLLYRILLFVNAAVGHSVERVHALASLYDEMIVEAALDLLAVWQAIDQNERATAIRRRLAASDRPAARPAAAPQRLATAPHKRLRRDAS
jgi:hypothetical protein